MLIVNADDLGRSKSATNTALSCYARQRITSTSAMVFMEDSERAAKLILESGIDVGLHLNFSEQFTAGFIPERLRHSQARIRRFLRTSKYALVLSNPLLREQFREVFQAQYSEFVRLIGHAPSHLDGHDHMHLASNMLIDEIMPFGAKVRRSFSFRPGEKNLVNRLYRAIVDRWLCGRHCLTDYFFALSQHSTLTRLQRVIRLAESSNVELMVHPEVREEYDLLMSDSYGSSLTKVRMAGYAELSRPGHPYADREGRTMSTQARIRHD
jgi:chitin disaccharide deacetylase